MNHPIYSLFIACLGLLLLCCDDVTPPESVGKQSDRDPNVIGTWKNIVFIRAKLSTRLNNAGGYDTTIYARTDSSLSDL